MEKVVLFLLAGVTLGRCYLAPFITPCHSTDLTCMKTSAQSAVPILAAGIPALGLQSLDPLKLDRVTASQAGLKMDFRNTVVKGLRNCRFMTLKRHGKQITYDIKCSVTLIGNYSLNGKLLVFPIEGDGRYKIKISDIIVSIILTVDEVTTDNVKHWNIADWKQGAVVKTNVNFQFQNLFKGNKQLSDTIHEFANTNWKDIFQEVAPPIVKAIVARIMMETKKFFAKVPLDNFALD